MKNMTLDELDAGYEKGKVTPREEFLAWLEAQAKKSKQDYRACSLSDKHKYGIRMDTLQSVLDQYKKINP